MTIFRKLINNAAEFAARKQSLGLIAINSGEFNYIAHKGDEWSLPVDMPVLCLSYFKTHKKECTFYHIFITQEDFNPALYQN